MLKCLTFYNPHRCIIKLEVVKQKVTLKGFQTDRMYQSIMPISDKTLSVSKYTRKYSRKYYKRDTASSVPQYTIMSDKIATVIMVNFAPSHYNVFYITYV